MNIILTQIWRAIFSYEFYRSHAWIQKFCPRGKEEQGTVCFPRGEGVFFVNFKLMCQRRGGGADRHPNSPYIRAFECNCSFYDSITWNYWETRLPEHRSTCYTLTFFVLALLVKSKTPTQSATFTLYSLTRISRTSPAQIGLFPGSGKAVVLPTILPRIKYQHTQTPTPTQTHHIMYTFEQNVLLCIRQWRQYN